MPPPPIPEPWAPVLVALITIGYGLLVEKWFVGRRSILFNLIQLIVLGATVYLPFSSLGLLFAYVVAGYFSLRLTGHQEIKQLFGAKTYGSLALAIAFNSVDDSNWIRPLVVWLMQQSSNFAFFFDNIILFAWIVIGTAVFILQWIIIRKNIVLRV